MRFGVVVVAAALGLSACGQSGSGPEAAAPEAGAEAADGVPAGAVPSGPAATPVADPGFRASLREEIERYKSRLSCDIETSEERGDPPAPAVLCAGITHAFVVVGNPASRTAADGSPVVEVHTESRSETPLDDNIIRELAAWYGLDIEGASAWYAGDRATPLEGGGYVMSATTGPDIQVRQAG
jgi:hypothetical protein